MDTIYMYCLRLVLSRTVIIGYTTVAIRGIGLLFVDSKSRYSFSFLLTRPTQHWLEV